MQYFYTDAANQPQGPVSIEDLRAWAAAGRLTAATMVIPVGGQEWQPLSTVALLRAPRQTEVLSILAFISGLIGLVPFMCLWLFSIPAVIMGHLALRRIKADPNLDGRGLALAGVILGYVSLAFVVLMIALVGGVIAFQAYFAGHPH